MLMSKEKSTVDRATKWRRSFFNWVDVSFSVGLREGGVKKGDCVADADTADCNERPAQMKITTLVRRRRKLSFIMSLQFVRFDVFLIKKSITI